MRNRARGVVARLMIESSLDSGHVDAEGAGSTSRSEALTRVKRIPILYRYYLLYYYYTHCAYKDQHSLKPNLT